MNILVKSTQQTTIQSLNTNDKIRTIISVKTPSTQKYDFESRANKMNTQQMEIQLKYS